VTDQDELGLPLKACNLEHLRRIMSVRLEETFELIERDLNQAGLLDYLRAGVFICGGGAHIPGIQKMPKISFMRRRRWAAPTHQRAEIRLGPARICHGHWAGEIRLLSVKKKPAGALTQCCGPPSASCAELNSVAL